MDQTVFNNLNIVIDQGVLLWVSGYRDSNYVSDGSILVISRFGRMRQVTIGERTYSIM